MDKADERLAYEYLLELYRDMLMRRVKKDENSLISNGIATEMELKSQADSYFGRTCQSLQSLNSKYNGQWNTLNQCELTTKKCSSSFRRCATTSCASTTLRNST